MNKHYSFDMPAAPPAAPPVLGGRHDDARSDARLLAEDATYLARNANTYEAAIAKALASIALSLAFKS